LLLFGDGSFDFRHIYGDLPDQNFIPTYETIESLDPLAAFPSDDYFALLDDDNPVNLRGDLDIAVGRLPVRTIEEAEAIVTKIINYETNPQTLGEWRNQIGFFAQHHVPFKKATRSLKIRRQDIPILYRIRSIGMHLIKSRLLGVIDIQMPIKSSIELSRMDYL
jgi:hypothetical protein